MVLKGHGLKHSFSFWCSGGFSFRLGPVDVTWSIYNRFVGLALTPKNLLSKDLYKETIIRNPEKVASSGSRCGVGRMNAWDQGFRLKSYNVVDERRPRKGHKLHCLEVISTLMYSKPLSRKSTPQQRIAENSKAQAPNREPRRNPGPKIIRSE